MKLFGFCKKCGEVTEAAIEKKDLPQWRVFDAVERRGYLGGWSMGQFLGRQIAKLAEEFGEMTAEYGFTLPVALQTRIQDAADEGKMEFDGGIWIDPYLEAERLDRMWNELVDMQVVMFCTASAINCLLGDERDLMEDAMRKAEKDVRRGVRK